MSVISSILAFLVALTILIAVHEFGHFWVARKMGVKVLRFSIGFGAPLWRRRGKDGTEYVIAWIPLGGYVHMLGEQGEDVTEAEQGQAFNQKSVWARFAIVFAGPAFNLIFAFVAYWFLAVVGMPGIKPILGDVATHSPAERAGFVAQDTIVAIDGEAMATWGAVRFALLKGVMDGRSVQVDVDTFEGRQQRYALDLSEAFDVLQGARLSKVLGLQALRIDYPARIDVLEPGGRGEIGGLQSGDLVLSANGEKIESWFAWRMFVQERPEEPIRVVLDRNGVITETVITPALVSNKCRSYGRIGAGPLLPEEQLASYRAVEQYGVFSGALNAVDKTWSMSVLMLKMIGKMVVGDASVKNISGPVMIAQVAGKTASIGYVSFITFLAIISVSLGVLNLLPIPMLDGGHLFYYGIEIIRGKPLSERSQQFGQSIGIALLAMLMSLALYLDLERLITDPPCEVPVVETKSTSEIEHK